MHDLCWKQGAPDSVKRTLVEIEGEKPETLEGWRRLFESAGLVQINAVENSETLSRWFKESRKQLGLKGMLILYVKIIRRWGLRGAWRVLRSQRVFLSKFLGYALVIGTKG